ncbi:MAG TPA: hypothetical protein VHP58_00185 [Alphaproteobacteria bacterium]|nr:hypothetical protein [Alphaproteobacteria bacterium]
MTDRTLAEKWEAVTAYCHMQIHVLRELRTNETEQNEYAIEDTPAERAEAIEYYSERLARYEALLEKLNNGDLEALEQAYAEVLKHEEGLATIEAMVERYGTGEKKPTLN